MGFQHQKESRVLNGVIGLQFCVAVWPLCSFLPYILVSCIIFGKIFLAVWTNIFAHVPAGILFLKVGWLLITCI